MHQERPAEWAHVSTRRRQQALCLPAEPPRVWAGPLCHLVPPPSLLVQPPRRPAETSQVWAEPLCPLPPPPSLLVELPLVWAEPLCPQVPPGRHLVKPFRLVESLRLWQPRLVSREDRIGLEKQSSLWPSWHQVASSQHGLPHARSTPPTDSDATRDLTWAACSHRTRHAAVSKSGVCVALPYQPSPMGGGNTWTTSTHVTLLLPMCARRRHWTRPQD